MPVITAATAMYSTVQSNSETRMPMGTSRCGLAGFLGVRRDRIEADEGEEHDRRPEHDARQAVGRERAADRVVDRHQPAIQADHAQQSPRAGRLLLALRSHFGQKVLDDRPVEFRLRAGRPRSAIDAAIWPCRGLGRGEIRPACFSRSRLLLRPLAGGRWRSAASSAARDPFSGNCVHPSGRCFFTKLRNRPRLLRQAPARSRESPVQFAG